MLMKGLHWHHGIPLGFRQPWQWVVACADGGEGGSPFPRGGGCRSRRRLWWWWREQEPATAPQAPSAPCPSPKAARGSGGASCCLQETSKMDLWCDSVNGNVYVPMIPGPAWLCSSTVAFRDPFGSCKSVLISWTLTYLWLRPCTWHLTQTLTQPMFWTSSLNPHWTNQ